MIEFLSLTDFSRVLQLEAKEMFIVIKRIIVIHSDFLVNFLSIWV